MCMVLCRNKNMQCYEQRGFLPFVIPGYSNTEEITDCLRFLRNAEVKISFMQDMVHL